MKSWSISCEHRHSALECSHSESHCGLFPSKGSEEVGSSLINHDTWSSWKILGMTTDDPTIRRQVPICSSTYASGSEQIPSMLRLVLADLAADYLFHVQGLESSSGFKSYSQGTWLQNRNCKEYIEALRTICLVFQICIAHSPNWWCLSSLYRFASSLQHHPCRTWGAHVANPNQLLSSSVKQLRSKKCEEWTYIISR